MSKKVRMTGRAEFTWSKLVTVDDDFDVENDIEDYPLYVDELADYVENEEVTVEKAVVIANKKKVV